jgi:hypothetical protein
MSTIRVVYEAEPDFPAHPDAVRYQAGEFWVDVFGGEPRSEELDRLLEQLGRLAYQRRREEREKIAQQVLERMKSTNGRGFLGAAD